MTITPEKDGPRIHIRFEDGRGEGIPCPQTRQGLYAIPCEPGKAMGYAVWDDKTEKLVWKGLYPCEEYPVDFLIWDLPPLTDKDAHPQQERTGTP